MYEKLKKILKPLSIIFLVCFLVSGATELCIVIDEDHFITNRNGTNEHVIDLLDEGSVGQEVLVNMTRNINIATSIDVNNANEVVVIFAGELQKTMVRSLVREESLF